MTVTVWFVLFLKELIVDKMMMDQAHFGEYLLRQQMLHAASLSGLRKFLYQSYFLLNYVFIMYFLLNV